MARAGLCHQTRLQFTIVKLAFVAPGISEAWTRPNQGCVRVRHAHVPDTCPTRFDRVRHESMSLSRRTRSTRVLDTVKSCLGHGAGLLGREFIGSVN